MANKTEQSLTEIAYLDILGRIVESRLPLSRPLKETQLAQELGISRTPVREALHRLELEGLLVNSDTGRYTVRLPSAQEIQEAAEILRVLDTLLFDRAARNATKEQRTLLVSLARQMVTAAEAGDDELWNTLDDQFHDVIRDAANNSQASDIVNQVRRRIQRFSRRPDFSKARFVPCSMEHLDLALAIRDRDFDAIRDGVVRHIDKMEVSVAQTIESLSMFLGDDV
jgi:DNA-binding GntR family transcriptional regulator